MLYSLVYVSSATHLFTQEELKSLLEQARESNTRAEISGMLLYKDGNFMQLLEGERAAVENLYARISADPRHRGAIRLLKGDIEQRIFQQWSMGFRDLNAETTKTPGYSDFLNTPLTAEHFGDQPDRALKLLRTFKSSM